MKVLRDVLVVTFALLFIISCETNKGNFLLINNSNDAISTASVKVCGQSIEFSNIPHLKSVVGSYMVKSDSHFDIVVKFNNGKEIHKQIGYVTNGVNFRYEIIVTETDIKLQLLKKLRKSERSGT